ncbi:Clp protease N-terminal domain-containing protein [Conexibacter woesei]|uniref:Clp domain protein n=1 Tax=Conexibacter woesei (strain DSM 14684 / CCUG 47730 / CIP 108061 / JCM 11494 / NBRC 100937 / ID131577) TaxID=469383 RepID=D3FF80_CONWI|nr:Clp protease N-terminal domain-containing protein [Conexibacter woesei]ADB51797.1 Clp domain protein [Conexibacter woesei DSM 14684]
MKLKNPLKDMRTIRALLEGAEREAQAEGEDRAGAEHLLLSALALPDGTARQAFERAGSDPDALRQAIAAVHADALRGIGIEPPDEQTLPVASRPDASGPMRTGATCQAAFQRASELSRPGHLLGAHVVLAATELTEGVTPRALRAAGVDRDALAAAAQATLDA